MIALKALRITAMFSCAVFTRTIRTLVSMGFPTFAKASPAVPERSGCCR